ncbi:hypothetical protein [Pseudomonas pergaminensis]
MNNCKLIFRFISDTPWSVCEGLSARLPEGIEDNQALDVHYVYWADEKRNGDGLDTGGTLLTVVDWSKSVSEGVEIWTVAFGAAVRAPGIVSAMFSKEEIVPEGSSKTFFERGEIIDLTAVKPADRGDYILSIDSAKDAMSRYYGVDSSFITVKIEK